MVIVCPKCKGNCTIEVKIPTTNPKGYYKELIAQVGCPECGGTGKYDPCDDCDPVKNPKCNLCVGA